MNEARAFFFHFNKPASKAAKKPQISVHTKGKCIIVDNVICEVPSKGRISRRQPVFVMTGRGVVLVRDFGYMGGRTAIIKDQIKSFEHVWAV